LGEDCIVTVLQRVQKPEHELQWLSNRSVGESFTGYDPSGRDACVWILHAMYENPSLRRLGTHDDLRPAQLERGAAQPVIIGEVNLDEQTTVTGVPLGCVVPALHGGGCGGRTTCPRPAFL
jgi:hypothetical protein